MKKIFTFILACMAIALPLSAQNSNGEAEGEANLYKDGLLIESSSDLNVTFPVSDSGLYTVEIITENKTLTGSIEI